jgi:hypothetical protein
MKKLIGLVGRSGMLLAALGFGVGIVLPALAPTSSVSAAALTARKITLSSSADGNTSTDYNGVAVPAGNGGNGAQARHTFNFTTPATTNIGSIAFMYCDTPFVGTACTMPAGMDASAITALTATTGLTGMTVNSGASSSTGWFATNGACTGSRTNCVLISRTAVSETAGAKQVSFGQGGGGYIKNPTANGTFYVRIITFSDAAFTTKVDEGTVAASIATDIDIEAKVQEKLNFSVSATPSTPNGTTCSALTGPGVLTMGSGGVLDPTIAYDARSYFRVSTNSANGTTVQYTGDTLKTASGTFNINAPAGPLASTVGTEQFGLAIDISDTQTGNGYSFSQLDRTPYTTYDAGAGTITNAGTAEFGFSTASVTTPVTIAASPGIVSCDTGSVRYIANISTTTEPGIYRTSIGYIATPTY